MNLFNSSIHGLIEHHIYIGDNMYATLFYNVIMPDVLDKLKYTACLQYPLLLALQPLSSTLKENKGTSIR